MSFGVETNTVEPSADRLLNTLTGAVRSTVKLKLCELVRLPRLVATTLTVCKPSVRVGELGSTEKAMVNGDVPEPVSVVELPPSRLQLTPDKFALVAVPVKGTLWFTLEPARVELTERTGLVRSILN